MRTPIVPANETGEATPIHEFEGWGQNRDHPSDYRFFLPVQRSTSRVDSGRRKEKREMMQHVADAFTAVAVLTGLWAAWLWRRSARVTIDPGPGCVWGLQDVQDRSWVMALLGAALVGGELNSRAATWTAVSIVLQTIATVLGRLAMPG